MDGLRILYFPWEGLSALLRALSLSGAAGNALAFFLYVCISLLPAAGLLLILRKERRGFSGADVWLLVLSAYTFYLLYAFINPVLLTYHFPGRFEGADLAKDVLPLMKSVFAGLWLTILAAWILLTLNRKLRQEEILDRKEFLYRGARALLCAVIALKALTVLFTGWQEVAFGILRLKENAGATNWDYAALTLHAVTVLIPEGFLLMVLVQMLELLKALRETGFDRAEVKAARNLAGAAAATVSAAVFCSLIWNGALFFLSGKLMHLDYQWELSLSPLLTAFGALLLARYVRAAGELKQERLCGVLVTVGDAGEGLRQEESLEGSTFSSIQELEEALSAPAAAEGTRREDGVYTFAGVDGHFLGIFEEEDQEGSCVRFANDGSFGVVKAETKVTDTGTLHRMEAVVMTDTGLREPVYLNPVYQRGDGTVYVQLDGGGYLLFGAAGGEVFGTSYSSTNTREIRGKQEVNTTELAVSLQAGVPAETVRLLEMDGENRLIRTQEISREMKEAALHEETAYVIVEEKRRDGSLMRSLYDTGQDTENEDGFLHKVYYSGTDGILVPAELKIGGL